MEALEEQAAKERSDRQAMAKEVECYRKQHERMLANGRQELASLAGQIGAINSKQRRLIETADQMDILQNQFTHNHDILHLERMRGAIDNMKVYKNMAGMTVGWRHLGALFNFATIKKAYPLCCSYEKTLRKQISVPNK